jgi:hypothetical protein
MYICTIPLIINRFLPFNHSYRETDPILQCSNSIQMLLCTLLCRVTFCSLFHGLLSPILQRSKFTNVHTPLYTPVLSGIRVLCFTAYWAWYCNEAVFSVLTVIRVLCFAAYWAQYCNEASSPTYTLLYILRCWLAFVFFVSRPIEPNTAAKQVHQRTRSFVCSGVEWHSRSCFAAYWAQYCNKAVFFSHAPLCSLSLSDPRVLSVSQPVVLLCMHPSQINFSVCSLYTRKCINSQNASFSVTFRFQHFFWLQNVLFCVVHTYLHTAVCLFVCSRNNHIRYHIRRLQIIRYYIRYRNWPSTFLWRERYCF